MKEAKINIEEPEKPKGRKGAKKADESVEEVITEEKQEIPQEKEEVEENPQENNIEPIQENERVEEEIKEENTEVKKYRVLIGILGKTRQGGEIELTDEEAAEFLKEEYIEEV